jgi:adenosylcobinamide kinase/adenosylcobinamide-phosphate guanylyltransferase
MNPFAPVAPDEPPGSQTQLILGGARSGKSSLAEARALAAERAGYEVLYLATAQPVDSAADPEMAARIARHRERRPAHWGLLEEPLQLAATLRAQAAAQRLLLVDCLTLWLSNLLFAGAAARQAEAGADIDCPLLRDATAELVDALPQLPGQIVLVSNEVGCGIVPGNAISRLFADEQGRLNQRVAAACARVTLVAAGLPLELKSHQSK